MDAGLLQCAQLGEVAVVGSRSGVLELAIEGSVMVCGLWWDWD